MDIQSRLELVIKSLDISDREFALKLGISPSTLSNVLGGRRSNPSLDVLQKVKDAYPDINLNWLISGEGDLWLHHDDQAEQLPLFKEEVEEGKILIINNKEEDKTEQHQSKTSRSHLEEKNEQPIAVNKHDYNDLAPANGAVRIKRVNINYLSGEVKIDYH